jgi:hypothetical protein
MPAAILVVNVQGPSSAVDSLTAPKAERAAATTTLLQAQRLATNLMPMLLQCQGPSPPVQVVKVDGVDAQAL